MRGVSRDMNIFVYGDESGVFDKAHNEVFVFGGLVFLDKKSKEIALRKYLHAERALLPSYSKNGCKKELKACRIKRKHKESLFRSTNSCIRYAFIVTQQKVNDNIFNDKKSKQRYLDYVYKVGLKSVMGRLIASGTINPHCVENIFIRFDEHTTATDGKYELKEGIEEEFKRGTYNFRYNTFHKPIFPEMTGCVELTFKDSKDDPLIRASDIIANKAWRHEIGGRSLEFNGKAIVVRFP